MRLSFFRHAVALFLCLLVTGCCSVQTRNPGCDMQCEVVLVRGLVGYWPGVEDLAARFECCGFRTRTICGAMHADHVARKLAQEYCSGQRQGPILLVGYSLGANDVVRMAGVFAEHGLCVDSLVLLESPYLDTVPSNVRRCTNYYVSRPDTDWLPWFRGLPMNRESTGTAMANVDLGNCPDRRFQEENHFVICFNDEVHQLLVSQVMCDLYGRAVAPSQMAVEASLLDGPPQEEAVAVPTF